MIERGPEVKQFEKHRIIDVGKDILKVIIKVVVVLSGKHNYSCTCILITIIMRNLFNDTRPIVSRIVSNTRIHLF